MIGFLQRVFGKSDAAPIPYEESKRLSQSGRVKERLRVATHTELRPEVLYFLAQDGSRTTAMTRYARTSPARLRCWRRA